jgi:acetyltransferase-like isoleucine patch superfamily enzyme
MGMRSRARKELRKWREEPLAAVAFEARLMAVRRRHQFAEFGAGSILHRPLWLYGTKHATVGRYCLLMHQAWISVERSAWRLPEPALVIGDRVTLRPFCSISAALSVVIEDEVAIGACSGIYDSDHTSTQDTTSIFDNPSVAKPVRIGASTWIGDRVSILAGSQIGRQCVIGANSVVRGTIPDYSIAVGAPARVIGSTRDEHQAG